MTDRRGASFSRFPRLSAIIAGCAAACAPLLTGCGVIPDAWARSQRPVVVMTWAPEGTAATNMPGMPAMAQAYARWVNRRGGLAGRELKVLTCNERNDIVAAGRCARRAVAKKAVAVVGSYSQYVRFFMPQLEAAGIPYIGGYGISGEEFSSPLSYPVNGGTPALLAGNGRQLARTCEKVSLVRPDTIAGDQMPTLLNAGLQQGRRPKATDVRAPEDANQYTRQAELAFAGAGAQRLPGRIVAAGARANDGCVAAVLGERTDTFVDSLWRLQKEHARVRISSVLGSVGQSLVNRTGGPNSPFEGSYVTGWYPVSSDARWDAMRKAVEEQAFGDNRIDTTDPGVQTTWIAYRVLQAAVESIGKGKEISAHSVRRALDTGAGDGGIDTGGLTPKLSWRYEDMLAVTGFPRIANAMVTYQEIRGGKLVAMRRGFVNVAKTLEHQAAQL